MTEWLGWREAMRRALYGRDGFYRRTAPAAHFRTSVHVSPLFASALRQLAERVDEALGRPDGFSVVDIGAGRGELLADIARDAPTRWRLTAVEIAERPDQLDDRIDWRDTVPQGISGLIIANEWLDNVPCEVVERSPDGTRLVEVDPATGAERLGEPPDPATRAWLDHWWLSQGQRTSQDQTNHHRTTSQQTDDGQTTYDGTSEAPSELPERAEVGITRDDAWSALISGLASGAAVAIDYAHVADARPRHGTLTGYLAGRQVTAIPNGSRDVTAHVAFDACAAAGRAAGADTTLLLRQREALRALGVSGARPPIELAHADPRGYVRALSAASEAAELTDPLGLGGFLWLIQTRGVPLPLDVPR